MTTPTITAEQAAIDLGFTEAIDKALSMQQQTEAQPPVDQAPPPQEETATGKRATGERRPCPDCGKEVNWLADNSRPRQHKCEPTVKAQEAQLPVAETSAPQPQAQPAQAPSGISVDVVIQKYIDTRDEIAEINKEAEARIAVLKEFQVKREAWLKGQLEALGVESLRAAAGTVFKDKKRFASVADNETFLSWVHEDWDTRRFFLTKGVSKSMVEDRLAKGEVPPPGVNYTTVEDVKIRRS